MSAERWIEYTVRITLKTNEGSFGIRYEHQGEFRCCAQSSHDARAIAGPHVPGATRSIDVTRMVEIVSSVPVSREAFPIEHAPLKSLREVEIEREEMEFV